VCTYAARTRIPSAWLTPLEREPRPRDLRPSNAPPAAVRVTYAATIAVCTGRASAAAVRDMSSGHYGDERTVLVLRLSGASVAKARRFGRRGWWSGSRAQVSVQTLETAVAQVLQQGWWYRIWYISRYPVIGTYLYIDVRVPHKSTIVFVWIARNTISFQLVYIVSDGSDDF